MFLILLRTTLVALALNSPLFAGEVYYTGFENFIVGPDKIAGTDGWTGSASHAGLDLSGIAGEANHLLAGIGNAAYVGGNDGALPYNPSSSYRTVNVRRAFNVDPAALGQEVVQFRVNFGIKDSTGFSILRDNFEFAFYNQAGYLIGYIQFDNTTMDTTGQAPAQVIRRSEYRTSPFPASWVGVDTGLTFTYDVLMELVVRINFRTNRWSASLDGVAIFSDQTFYSGSYTKNLGVVAAQMQIYTPRGQTNSPMPGTNYMIFDDFAVRIDPPVPTIIWDFTRDAATGATKISWLEEAAYHYQIQYTSSLTQPWKSDLPGSYITAANTGRSPVFTDTSAAGKAKRFYRVVPSNP